jgi:peptidoglycan hydrolase FlgJ
MRVESGEWGVASGRASEGAFSPVTRHSPLATDKARKASQDFEAMFLEQMLERVFASSGEEGPLGDNGPGGAVYRSMLVKEYAGGITKAGGVGVADAVYREMLRLQEGSHAQRI